MEAGGSPGGSASHLDVPGTGAADRTLSVRYVEQERRLATNDELVFGRGADLDVDTNPFLHRRLGRFVFREGWWWLQNVGSSIVITMIDPTSGAASRLPSAVEAVITAPLTLVRFGAGRSTYELVAEQPPIVGSPVEDAVIDEFGSTRTIDPGELPLTVDQRALLVALAGDHLRDVLAPIRVPTNQEVAELLGWSTSKLNRKLDWLCDRLTRLGVEGLHGSDRRAIDRRQRLVVYAVERGLIGDADLEEPR